MTWYVIVPPWMNLSAIVHDAATFGFQLVVTCIEVVYVLMN